VRQVFGAAGLWQAGTPQASFPTFSTILIFSPLSCCMNSSFIYIHKRQASLVKCINKYKYKYMYLTKLA
jgi:hypothetical protein